jgi:DNA-directed RNA polymerase I, II, and III subunit RPABC2
MDKDLDPEQIQQDAIVQEDNEADPTDNVVDPTYNVVDPIDVDTDESDEELDDEELDDEDEPINDNLFQDRQMENPFNTSDNDNESDDEDDDDDENYLQKFDEASQQKIISDFHPELHSHNYHEIDILSRVVRDETGQIIDPLHRTLPFITRYEKARILGERAKQINAGGKPLVEVEPTVLDGYLIALKEFDEKKIPFILKRPLPNGGCEYWKFSDLEILG